MSTLFSQHKLIITHKMLSIVGTMHSASASLLYYASKPGVTPGTMFGTQSTLMLMSVEYCLLEHEENSITCESSHSVTSTNVVFHLHSMSVNE